MSTLTGQTFLLPDLGEGLTEASVVQWLVAEGDVVGVDQAVAEVETAKSVVEVPSPYAGRVGELHAAEGETIEVGRPLITIVTEGGAADGTPVGPAAGTADVGPDATGGADGDPAARREAETYREEERAGSGNVLVGYGTTSTSGSGRRRRPRRPGPPADDRPVKVISPIVRRLAREAGLDLRSVRPTGAGGVVTRSDVLAAVAVARSGAGVPVAGGAPAGTGDLVPGRGPDTTPTPSAPTPSAPTPGGPARAGRRIPLTGFQRAASAVLTRSRREIPEATVWVDVDATALWELREAARLPGDDGPGLMTYVARFVVEALRRYPVLNARLDVERGEIVVPDRVNLGLAVQGEHGLVAPAVLGADGLSTAQLDAAIRDVVERARAGRSTPEELAAGTFTLNNYGGLGVDGSAPIINHPQVAMLGLGRVIERPWVVDGAIVPRRITQLSFVFDHRVCDGVTAAAFLRTVADAIEHPLPAVVRL